ncbi:WD40 repeat protein [Tahibacter aquaticus]|uniref:WD40 repeat protein n=2 Tax=Tahibacter aquaticus TaxID=520092 RepID=A0A4R6Z2N5_9GAMM|nr:WD40 repeat protein [Tahibacter aquaticus]
MRGTCAVLLCLGSTAVAALQATVPQRETVSYLGGPSEGPCGLPQLSATARYLVFTCIARDLVPGQFAGTYNTYRRDRSTGIVTRVSIDSQNRPESGGGDRGFVSADGNQVVFSSSTRLHPDVPPRPIGGPADVFPSHVFLRDLAASTTQLIARDPRGAAPPRYGARLLDVAFARSLVAFDASTDLMADPPLPFSQPNQLYLRNWQSGSLERINVRPDGGASAFDAYAPSISPDGRYIAFLSGASDLGPANPTGDSQLLLRDRQNQTTQRISVPYHGGEFARAYYQWGSAQFSGDGRYLAITADSEELVPGGAPDFLDAYVVDLATRRFELISTGHAGQAPDNASFNSVVSGNGRYVAFYSRARNLTATPQPYPAVYVKDRATGDIVNVSAALGEPHQYHVSDISLSEDGSAVAFSWRHRADEPLLGGRWLIYSARLSGAPLAPPMPVPVLGPRAAGMLGIGIVMLGLYALRRRATRRRVASRYPRAL